MVVNTEIHNGSKAENQCKWSAQPKMGHLRPPLPKAQGSLGGRKAVRASSQGLVSSEHNRTAVVRNSQEGCPVHMEEVCESLP